MSAIGGDAGGGTRAALSRTDRGAAVRRAGGRVGAIGLAALLLVWWIALRPVSLGGEVSYVMIRGTSMLPTYETGDLVIARSASDYGVGDVVAYRVPAGEVGAGRIVVHRIVGGDSTKGFILRGDDNPTIDPWMPAEQDVVGRQWLRFAQAGRVIALLHQPAALGALAAAVVIAWFALRRPSKDANGRRSEGRDRRVAQRLSFP